MNFGAYYKENQSWGNNGMHAPKMMILAQTAVLAGAVTLLLAAGAPAMPESAADPAQRGSVRQHDAPAPFTACILREHEGQIGIFREGEADPIRVLPVFVFTLPAADRAALRRGIRAESAEALTHLIEDYTG